MWVVLSVVKGFMCAVIKFVKVLTESVEEDGCRVVKAYAYCNVAL